MSILLHAKIGADHAMLFTDSLFLFYFVPSVLLCLAFVCRSGRGLAYPALGKALIFGSTLLFYGCQEPWWLCPFLICIFFDFLWASLLDRARGIGWRRMLVSLSVIQNLGLLALFKYWHFIRETIVLHRPTWSEFLPQLLMDNKAVALPAGISFYTFESLSFVIDVYRKEISPPKNPLDFFAFIAMFPRFVAGPIVRYRELAPQLQRFGGLQMEKGLFLFLCGFCLKAAFADQFAVLSHYAFESDGVVGFWAAWVGVLAYTFQIYFDFSGYSLMAIGLGACLGFDFPENFDKPYTAQSLTEFWHRWHKTLSRWLRDYLYIPLGGSRGGKIQTYRNLLLTMVLGGIWHGAGWTFAAWGAWHGIGLVLERLFPKVATWSGARVQTFLWVVVGWVFFRAKSLEEAGVLLSAMANPLVENGGFNLSGFQSNPISTLLCFLGVFYCFWVEPNVRYSHAVAPSWSSVLGLLHALLPLGGSEVLPEGLVPQPFHGPFSQVLPSRPLAERKGD